MAALAEGEIERAVALAEGVQDVGTRDLVLAEIARESGRDVCDRITDLSVRDGCKSTIDRHHLRLPEAQAGAGGTRKSVGEVPAVCSDQPAALVDTCLLREAEAVPVGGAAAFCAAVTDADRAAECIVRLSERTVFEGQPDAAKALCSGLRGGTWREDCFFRLSETLPDLAPVQRAELCGEAGRFESFCIFHVASGAGMNTAAGLQGQSFDQAIAALADTTRQLQDGIDHPVVSDDALAREVWTTGLTHLFMGANAPADLGLWRDRVAGLQDPTVRSLAEPLLTLSWARSRLHQDRSLEQWASAWDQAVAATAQGASAAPLDLTQPAPGSEHPPGQSPGVLADDACDQLDPKLRTLVAVLWGLGPQDWETGRTAVEAALAHASPAVRHAQVQLLEERIWSWRNEAPPPAWLAEALTRGVEAEQNPAVETAMRTLLAGVKSGARPGGQPFAGPALCGTTPASSAAAEQR